MKKIFVLVVLVVFNVSAMAQKKIWSQEPTAFRNVPFGATEAEMKASTDSFTDRVSCSDMRDWSLKIDKGRECTTEFGLNSVPIFVVLTFVDDKFVTAGGVFDSRSYPEVKAVFLDRYGPPMITRRSTVGGSKERAADARTPRINPHNSPHLQPIDTRSNLML